MRERARRAEHDRRADQQADVADAHGEERLQRGARLLASSSHQCPISRNEQRPMISQPRISWTMFSARTIVNMPALNSVMRGEEVGVAAVAAHVLERVDLHQRGDERDEQQQHHRQAVDVLADAELARRRSATTSTT